MSDEIVVVGAGPAGIAAAVTASQFRSAVTLIDDNPRAGGQIWRGDPNASPWLDRLKSASSVTLNYGARVISVDSTNRIISTDSRQKQIYYSRLILATGGRELFLPFPGWTLPNIFGIGGLQALAKSGLPVEGKRVVVAGTGPLLLAVAVYLHKKGARISLIAEQAKFPRLAQFALSLAAHPGKLQQSLELAPLRFGIRYRTNCYVEAAVGSKRVERVRLRQGSRIWEEPCDYLANSYGFVPNSEIASLIGCALESGAVKVDQNQQTSVPNVYCAGECAGIGGVDTAILEGQIASYAATDQLAKADALRPALREAKSFARRLNQTFQPRAELRNLAQPDTIVCRCEDVPLSRLRNADSWRSAKLHERCGMGPCQGRICGPAVQFILGWEPSSIRPPLFPTSIENLLQPQENPHK